MEERRIMVEVTEEEYEKIRSGILNENIPTHDEVKKEVLENMSVEDIKVLLRAHSEDVLKEFTDGELIDQIIRRSEKDSPQFIRDPVSARDYVLVTGSLNKVKKINYSKIDEPEIESDDSFSWKLKAYN